MSYNNINTVEKLCAVKDAYKHDTETDKMFVEAMKEIVLFHKEHSAFYSRLLEKNKFDINTLSAVEGCAAIPFVYADFFKTHIVKSVGDDQITDHYTSSGTTGQKSQMFFDERSLGSAIKMIDFEMDYLGFNSPDTKSNYIMYSYQIPEDSKLGTANTDKRMTKYSPPAEIEYALKQNGRGGYDFDIFGIINALQRYAKQDLPVRILGFPSFFYFTLQQMKDLKIKPVKLNPKSATLFGGGWKGFAGKEISKKELYETGEEILGIPNNRFCDGFGSVEHCIPYMECSNHHFHVPTWSRVFIRDVRTLDVLPFGNSGFLQFVSPYITSAPAHSVLMGDLAVLHPASKCGCGIKTPYFEIPGRAGTSKNKSCAIAAAELLKR
ncbi:acyl-protein synthetase [Spirochaetia bacterium]|nr:acyl-protein synthetase [Spirochaetia bacterium]